MTNYDICIIGGGVIGCAIARELSKYQLSVCLLEKNDDVACDATKANSGIVHGGYAATYGTLKAKFSATGNSMYRKLDKELNFGFSEIGSLVIGFNKKDAATIKNLYENGLKNQVPGLEIVNAEFVKNKEPYLNKDISVALYCAGAGITSPYELAIALAENAIENGVKLYLNSKVITIDKIENNFHIKSNNSTIKSKIVINAAGLYSDEVANLIGLNDFKITPRQGQYLLFDKDQGHLTNSVIFQTPTKVSKGILVTNTLHGNLLIGPDANDIKDKDNLDTTANNIEQIITTARKSLPNFEMQKVITSFAGNRASSNRGDFIIEESEVKGFINVAGIESPGLTAAPAIALKVAELVAATDLELIENPNFNPYRKPYKMISKLKQNELQALIKKQPAYGRVICRCETVSEGEIQEVLRRPIPINSLDAIKRRVRAGMGRCQSGFCTPRLLEIINKELNIPLENITKKGRGSEMIIGKTK